MKRYTYLFLAASLGICSATALVDRLINVPDWIAYLLMILAVTFLILHVRDYRKSK